MSYQGDSSLAAEIQDRVLSTFDQTARLAGVGKVQEAQLGCDFILRLDPYFEPARTLQSKLEGADGPVDVSDVQGKPQPIASSEVLKTVALSPEEIEKLMATDGPPAKAEVAEASVETEQPAVVAAETTPEAADQAEPPQTAERKPVGRVLIGGPEETPGVAEQTAAAESQTEQARSLGGGDKIQQLLDQGQASFDQEKYQEAIDSWSRIFLIDIDHAEATKRIDLARQLKEEREREIEEIFHEGVALADEEPAVAAAAFEKVLAMQPNHLPAREFLDSLNLSPPEEAAATGSKPADTAAPEVPAVSPEGAAEPLRAPTAGAVPEAPRHADDTFRMVARGPFGTRVHDDLVCTEWDEEEVLAMERRGGIKGKGSFYLVPIELGTRVRLREELRMPLGLLGELAFRLLFRRPLRRTFNRDIRKLKTLVEGGQDIGGPEE